MTDFGAPPGTFPPPPVPPPPPPPSFGDRSGPPWELPGPLVQRFIDTAKGVLLDAAPTFRNMRREGGLANPLVYYLIGGLVSVLGQAIWNGLGIMPSRFGGYGGSGLIGTLLIGACAVTIGIFIGSGIIHLMLMLLGGAKYPFETTFRTLCYAQGSASPIGALPLCGSLIAGLWGLYAVVVGLTETQEVSVGKALAAVLIPGVVCCLLVALFFGALAAALGFAALGNR